MVNSASPEAGAALHHEGLPELPPELQASASLAQLPWL